MDSAGNRVMLLLGAVELQFGRMTTDLNDVALLAWERKQPEAITKDPLWTLNCYRESLFLIDAVREDAAKLAPHASLSEARGQLLTSVGSIAANIAEGYGRMTAADRSKFLSYALGSAREAIIWYRTLRSSGHDDETSDRIERLARIRRMLIGLLKRPREGGARRFEPW
jgi:four helix bundle protein